MNLKLLQENKVLILKSYMKEQILIGVQPHSLILSMAAFPVKSLQETVSRTFPGGPVVKTLNFLCRGCGFDPWSGN